MSVKLPELERDIVKRVITALEDRRALYVDYNLEIPDDVVRSLESIRQEITAALAKVGDASPAVAPLRTMRAACREFLTEPHPDFPHTGQDRHHGRRAFSDGFFVALGQLRGIFGQQLALLAYLYDIDIEAELASILPPEPRASDDRI